ncbi:MAG: hypothetical protein GF350_02290, partial [Chitinivibrionales bacterium]|nr:hypothetical protein [Chitinivibrionales bacterium]
MPRKPSFIIATIIEYCLFAACVFLLAARNTAGLLSGIPFIGVLVSLVVGVSLAWVLAGARVSAEGACSIRTFGGLMVITLAAVHVTRMGGAPYRHTHGLFYLYTGIILLYAGLGNIVLWLCSIFIPALFETGTTYFYSGGEVDVSLVKLLPDLGVLAGIGVIPAIISRSRNAGSGESTGKRLPELLPFT